MNFHMHRGASGWGCIIVNICAWNIFIGGLCIVLGDLHQPLIVDIVTFRHQILNHLTKVRWLDQILNHGHWSSIKLCIVYSHFYRNGRPTYYCWTHSLVNKIKEVFKLRPANDKISVGTMGKYKTTKKS